ncbi:prephenate dehydratase [Desulfovirgula thermocuniculi]|uniref:prephenate dehydratase n=1 Tax=Desulfovirgula thermocuniculi TaxID=348842 RepID=UPI0004020F8A|nr:prephenate dehydratase [Desulfovirgula thermocuniculi]
MAKKVGYLGPNGTFSELAARRYRERLAGEVELVALASIYEVLAAVGEGRVDEGVVPLENFSEGSVGVVQDLLAHSFKDLRLCGEVVLPVAHCLLAPPGVGLGQVTRVLSHPQALAQCREFLSRHLPGAELVETASTAAAAEAVASAGAPWAAIGPLETAGKYGLAVLAERINDFVHNATRFVVVGREEGPYALPAKTSLILSLPHRPGALYEALGEFACRGINLTRIESRPSRRRLGEYLFFIDFEGHRQDEKVREALEALSARAEVRLLGSYPSSSLPFGSLSPIL